MASDDIWILGIRMTKFGKHLDKDIVDLASEAALDALAARGLSARMASSASDSGVDRSASFGPTTDIWFAA